MDIAGAELLLDFTEMPMRGRFVRTHRAASFRVMTARARRITALARTGLDFDHRGFDHAGAVERMQREDCCGGVTAGAGNSLRACELRAMQFGDAVNKIAQFLRAGVAFTVPSFIGGSVLQAKIRRQIDQRISDFFEFTETVHHLSVRQAEKQHVAGFQFGARDKLQFADPAQVGMYARYQFAGVTFRRHLPDFDPRME